MFRFKHALSAYHISSLAAIRASLLIPSKGGIGILSDRPIFTRCPLNLSLFARVSLPFLFFAFNTVSHADVFFSVDGRVTKNHVGYQKFISQSGGASVAIGLGSYIRLGLTHRIEVVRKQGFDEKADYAYFDKQDDITSNSVDLTFILYNGLVFMPYIGGGLVVKNYRSRVNSEKYSSRTPLLPHGTAGVGIRLTRKFTLKIFHNISPGKSITPSGQEEGMWDSHTHLGLTYQI